MVSSSFYEWELKDVVKITRKGGEGFTLFFFVKLNFEIAVDQKTRARDRNFEGVPDSRCPPMPAGQPRPYLDNFWLNFAKSP